jgi:hypothetical protein
MTTSNHLYTGAALALAVQRPFTGMFLALLSHFVLDSFPHYGRQGDNVIAWFHHKLTWAVEGLNIIGVPLLVYLLWGQPWWVFAAAGLAIVPDAVWIFRYAWYERYGIQASQMFLTKFHNYIQWGERPWGAAIEIPFFVVAAIVLASLVY